MLRPATQADLEPLYQIHRAAYMDVASRTWGPWDEQWQAQNFRKHFDPQKKQVIECDGCIAGYLQVMRHPDRIWLDEIVIAPGFQRRGLGRELLQQLVDESVAAKRPLQLQVLKINHALQWYQRSGFRITGENKTHFFMERPPMPWTVRPASESDVPAILGLIRELADYEKLTDACTATEDLLRRHLFGEHKAADALVAAVDDQTVAYAIYFKTFSTFLAKPGLYLEDIYVQPAHRNRGIGTSMLRALAQLALNKDYQRLEWTCLDWNAPSLAFYKSLGAANLSEWKLHRMTGEKLKSLAKK